MPLTEWDDHMRSLRQIIEHAEAYHASESRAIGWAFHSLTISEREAFDTWLVSINHVLAHEPGTTEQRFTRFMTDKVSGRYKGPLP